jgi:hypothetical protein
MAVSKGVRMLQFLAHDINYVKLNQITETRAKSLGITITDAIRKFTRSLGSDTDIFDVPAVLDDPKCPHCNNKSRSSFKTDGGFSKHKTCCERRNHGKENI